MIKIWNWLTGWYNTWQIKKNHPELYKYLCEVLDKPRDPAEWVEVPRPNGSSIFYHADTIERMRKLGEEDNGTVA